MELLATIVFLAGVIYLLCSKKANCTNEKKETTKGNTFSIPRNLSLFEEAGKLTYEHFMKANNAQEMHDFLLINDQDPKDFEGMDHFRIAERMKMKALLTGKAYTRHPY